MLKFIIRYNNALTLTAFTLGTLLLGLVHFLGDVPPLWTAIWAVAVTVIVGARVYLARLHWRRGAPAGAPTPAAAADSAS
ncbi:hypothetical protein OG625_01335 [Streptomyces sp. NBC_01351]|uniref:hypothetical protein n=1 Tax=Streptomyces sp. NBC_01351 TaxID=2903833 RepID=UPI002E305202|nr:hypothetical protein [Streptomyces sp. NBC_01351]